MVQYAIGEEIVAGHEDLKLLDFPSHLSNLNIDYSRFKREIHSENLDGLKQKLNQKEVSIQSISNIEIPAVGSSEKIFESFKLDFEQLVHNAYRLESSYLLCSIQNAPVTITKDNIERYFSKIASILHDLVLRSKNENLTIAIWAKPLTSENTIGLSDGIKYLESFYHKHENFGFAIDSSFFYFENDRLRNIFSMVPETFFVKCIQISEPYYYIDNDTNLIFNLPPNFRFQYEDFKLNIDSSPLMLGSMNSLVEASKELQSDILCKLYSKKYLKLLSFSNYASEHQQTKTHIQNYEEEIIKPLNESSEFVVHEHNSSQTELLTAIANDFEESSLYRAFCINELKKSIGLN